jgi:spore protease
MKTIQITNKGLNPGSGINNDRGEISKKTLGVDVIVVGIPTVVDIKTIVKDTTNSSINIKENLIVTPTNIDYLIEKLSIILANSLNKTLHKNYSRQITPLN